MDKAPVESEDSRTSLVGRKRKQSDPSDTASEPDHKKSKVARRKKDASGESSEPSGSTPHETEVYSTSPALARPLVKVEAGLPSPPSMRWNNHLSHGLRTSFGSRTKRTHISPTTDVPETSSSDSHGTSPKSHNEAHFSAKEISTPSKLSQKDLPHDGTSLGTAAVDFSSGLDVSPNIPLATSHRNVQTDTNVEETTDVDSPNHAPANDANHTANLSPKSVVGDLQDPEISSESHDHGTKMPANAQSSSAQELVYRSRGVIFTIDLPTMEIDGRLPSLERLEFTNFAPAFMRANHGKDQATRFKIVRNAFARYIRLCRADGIRDTELENSKVQSSLGKSSLAILKQARQSAALEVTVQEGTPSASTPEAKGAPSSQRVPLQAASKHQTNLAPRRLISLSVPEDEQKLPSQARKYPLPPVWLDPRSRLTASLEYYHISPAEIASHNREVDIYSDVEFSAHVMGEDDLKLVRRYFPSIADPDNLLCMVCAMMGHKAMLCPQLSCSHCTSPHAASACPHNQQCSKCSKMGHRTIDCVEKLMPAASERHPCALCQKVDHLDTDCHMLWRSFDADSASIRTVKTMTLDCYRCGKSGHLGAECGLNTSVLRTGASTWSWANASRFLDSHNNVEATRQRAQPAAVSGSGKGNTSNRNGVLHKANSSTLNEHDVLDDEGMQLRQTVTKKRNKQPISMTKSNFATTTSTWSRDPGLATKDTGPQQGTQSKPDKKSTLTGPQHAKKRGGKFSAPKRAAKDAAGEGAGRAHVKSKKSSISRQGDSTGATRGKKKAKRGRGGD